MKSSTEKTALGIILPLMIANKHYVPKSEATNDMRNILREIWNSSTVQEKAEIIMEIDSTIPHQLEPLLTGDELCWWLGITKATASRLRRLKMLPFVFVGGQLRYSKMAVMKSLKQNEKLYSKIFSPGKRLKINSNGKIEK